MNPDLLLLIADVERTLAKPCASLNAAFVDFKTAFSSARRNKAMLTRTKVDIAVIAHNLSNTIL